MAIEIWIDPKSHYQAAGQVSDGKMTDATVDDNNGTTVDRDAKYASKDEFFRWARKRANITW